MRSITCLFIHPTLQERVGNLHGGMEFLELCGFEKLEGNEFLFLAREKVDKAILNTAGAELNSAITNPFFGVLWVVKKLVQCILKPPGFFFAWRQLCLLGANCRFQVWSVRFHELSDRVHILLPYITENLWSNFLCICFYIPATGIFQISSLRWPVTSMHFTMLCSIKNKCRCTLMLAFYNDRFIRSSLII